MEEYVREVTSHISNSALSGDLVYVLGAGVNLCGRPSDQSWRDGNTFNFLPDAKELGAYLAEANGPFFRQKEKRLRDLARVSQYTAVARGPRDLYDDLHRVFNVDYQPTVVHHFLASVPGLLREHGPRRDYPLIVTTNYDDVLERAFSEKKEPVDVVAYIAQVENENAGRFRHMRVDGTECVIRNPGDYASLSLRDRPIILKMHGTVQRGSEESERDDYVITEDDYVEYLTHADISRLFPATLAAKLKNSHLLFLGYGLRDWNLRVMLYRLWRQSKLLKQSWAIQLQPDPVDKRLWDKKGVEIVEVRLEEFMDELSSQLREQLGSPAVPSS